ncbi:MAG: mechanosensitive ion channel protein MscS, partial [Pontibacter sp.]|nr:mechanosensitive ion channel protein MscS [Pontibacter sp.]
MLKTLLYAVLLGVGMAACLSQQDENTGSTESEPTETIFADTPAAPTTPSPETYVVEKKRVGSIRIGMPIDQLREQVNSGLRLTDTTLWQEGMQSTAYVVHPKGKQNGLLIEQNCNPDCKVWRISVQNSDFKTPKAISLGSKYSDIRQAYTISTVTF